MSPHNDGNLIPDLGENLRWKCGEIYTWNNAEVYAVECTLCDDKRFCSLLEFPKHMQVCHRNFECTSEEDENEHNSAKPAIVDKKEVPYSRAVALASEIHTRRTKENKETVKEGLMQDSDRKSENRNKILMVTTMENLVEQNQEMKTMDDTPVSHAHNIKNTDGTLHNTNRDQLWRKIVAEATADETEDLPIYSSRLLRDKQLLKQPYQIWAGQVRVSPSKVLTEQKGFTQSAETSLPTMKSHKQDRVVGHAFSLKTRLDSEQIILLIELYKAHSRLWNPSHEEFSKTERCDESWQQICSKLNAVFKQKFKINDLKVTISVLCQHYRTKKQTTLKNNLEANSEHNDESVQHFEMLSFLDDQLDVAESRRNILHNQNLKIIEIYKKFPLLWHSASRHKQSPVERIQALERMSEALRRHHQIQLSSRSIQGRLHALHKYYQKEKLKYLHCLRDNRKFRTNFKHFDQMQFLRKHIAPFECSFCSKIFEKLHERNEHINTWHHKNVEQKHQKNRKQQPQLLASAIDLKEAVGFTTEKQLAEKQSINEPTNTKTEKFLATLLEREPFMDIAANIFSEGESSSRHIQNICVHNYNEHKLLEVPHTLHTHSAKHSNIVNDIKVRNENTERKAPFDSVKSGAAFSEASNTPPPTEAFAAKSDPTHQILDTHFLATPQQHLTIANEPCSLLPTLNLNSPPTDLNTELILNSTQESNYDNVRYLKILNAPQQNFFLSAQQQFLDTPQILNSLPSSSNSPKSDFSIQYIPYDISCDHQILTHTQALSNAIGKNLNITQSTNLPQQLFDDTPISNSTYGNGSSSNLLESTKNFQIAANQIKSNAIQETSNSPFRSISPPAILSDQYFLEIPNSPSLILNTQITSNNIEEHFNSPSPHILDAQYYLNTTTTNTQQSLDVIEKNSSNFVLLKQHSISPHNITEITLTSKDNSNSLRKILNSPELSTISQHGTMNTQYTLNISQNNECSSHEVLTDSDQRAEMINTQNFLNNILQKEILNTRLLNTNMPAHIPAKSSIYATNSLASNDIPQYILSSSENVNINIPNIYFNDQPAAIKDTFIISKKTQPAFCVNSTELPKNGIIVYEIILNTPQATNKQSDNTNVPNNAIVISRRPISLIQTISSPQKSMSITPNIVNIMQQTVNTSQSFTNEVNLTQTRADQQPLPPSSMTSCSNNVNTFQYMMKVQPFSQDVVINPQEDRVNNIQKTMNNLQNSVNMSARLSNISKPTVLNNAVPPTIISPITPQGNALNVGKSYTTNDAPEENYYKLDFKNLPLKIKNSCTNPANTTETAFEGNSQDCVIQCEVFIPENFNGDSKDCISLVPCASVSTRFNEQQTHNLISIYKEQPSLWNPFHNDFNSRNARHIAWKSVTATFNKLNKLRVRWQSVYKKLTDLVKYYRKEKERINEGNLSSRWYYYNDFQFLDDYLDITSDTNKTLQEKKLNLKIIEIYKTYPQLWNTHLLQFKRRSQRTRHIQAMLSSLRGESNIQLSLDKLKRKLLEFRCSYRQEKEKRIECTRNNEVFESFYEYYQQLDFLEPHISPFICKVCGESFTKVTEITRHYRLTQHQKLSKKRIHVRGNPTPENDAKNVCHICGAKFTMRNNLIYHLNRHSGKRTHTCKICPKSFYNSTSLRVHERSHTKECPYVCEQCGHGFVNNSKLNQHRKRHSNQRDYVCNDCDKAFFTAFERDKHAKSHLKIRDQVCPICGKAFYFGSSIYTHMDIHNTEKKYACKICHKRFSQNSGLYRHKKWHLAQSK